MTSENDQTSFKLCPICHEDIDFFSYGACNHPTCVKCILKLRKFGSADEPDFSKCPTCRRNLNMIVIMESFIPFAQVNTASMRHDSQYDFVFPTQNIEKHYRDMLRSYCPICGEEKNSLSALNRHTTLEHQVSYCDLCIRYARLLPCEFIPMKPADLVVHRKWDKERRRGHPLCDFCEERFYEFEDLIHHIRDCHFLCDLCMTSGKFVVFREQHELLSHYGDAHHLCAECRAQQRISCFSTADHLGLHRFQEHPDAVNNDPDSWMPISIELARNADIVNNRRRDPLHPVVNRVDGVLNSTDGRLIAEGTSAGVRFRRPNPAEWTGDDFPALASSAAGSQPAGERSTRTGSGSVRTAQSSATPAAAGDSPAKQPGTTRGPGRSAHQGATMAALAGGGRSARLTADDFPSLSSSGSTNATPAPTWIKTSSSGRASVVSEASQRAQPRPKQPQSLPTDSDFPGLPQDSSRSVLATGTSTWGFPNATRSAQASSNRPASQPKPAKPTPPTASDFPDLSGGGGGGAQRTGSSVKGNSSAPLPPFTQKSGLHEPPKSQRNSTAKRRQRLAATDPDPIATEPPPVQAFLRQRQNRNADIRFAIAESLIRQDDDSDTERNKLNHIQVVEVLPNANRTTSESSSNAVTVPNDWGPEEFPSLGGPTPSQVQQPSKGSGKGKSGKKQTVRKPPSNGPSTNHVSAAATVVESLVPKVSAAGKKPTTTTTTAKKPAIPSTAGISEHDLVDTECLLYAGTPYFPVPEEATRNRDLIRTVERELSDWGGKTGFTRFADLSRRYRHKQLTATAYMEGLVGLLTPRTGTAVVDTGDAPKPPVWIAPMLALLPDVGLQRALLRVLQGQGAPRIPANLLPADCAARRNRGPISPPPAWAKAVLDLLQCCRECGQVCLRTDMQLHLQQAHPSK